ncbi:MAG TPA: hypothetical protein VHX38_33980 [Pseudonocardiaceae bacterium]|jgi:uncharacterized protein YukE|nr:hypothetical protein [Pseudonocardiaceae bacterium]
MADTATDTSADSDSKSTGDTLKDAALDLPLALPASKAVQAAGEGDYGSVASDVANFAMGAQGILEDPLNALISAGLGFLLDVIQPLKDALELVTGNPDALDEAAGDFSEIGKDIGNLGNELTQITQTGFANWTGDAKEAATKQVQNYFNGVEQTASTAGNVMMMLQLSSTLMEAAYNFIKGIIAQCVEWLIVTWVAALASTVFTFGASDAAATAATTAEVATEGANAADKVEEATSLVEKIVNVLKKLVQDLKDIQKAWKDLKDVKEVGTAAKDGEKAAKDAETVAKDGEKAAKDGETVAQDADKAAQDGDKAAQDGDKAAKDGETVAQDADKAAQDGDKAAQDDGKGDGDSPSGDKGGDGKSGDGDGNPPPPDPPKNIVQSTGTKLKDNFNENLHNSETAHSSLGSYLTTGTEHGIGHVAVDVGKETASNVAGDVINRGVYGAETAPDGQPDGDDYQDQSMSGNLID